MDQHPDLIIAGGGLAGGLCALALAARRPERSILLVEREPRLGGNHVWSFFDSDVAAAERDLLAPLVVARWPRHAVRFPAHARGFAEGYNSITSARLDRVLRAALGDRIIEGEVTRIGPDHVVLADGRRLDARATLDARGLGGPPEGLDCGYQKFVGQMLRVPGGHGLAEPVIMDATVDQAQGYRFVYCLPFEEEQVFVEDTYYRLDPDLDRDRLAARIADYAAAQGWVGAVVEQEEQGVLPVVTGGRWDRFWPEDDPVARAGVRAGLFHQLTSYSLPEAARFARWLARQPALDGTALAQATRKAATRHWRASRFERMLARMLFHAADPPERYRVLERFYRLPAGLIARFYAGNTTLADKVRILAGKPPVRISRALEALIGVRP
ncbi:lycopene beta-cyclase CrtY [Sphingomicrobium astaxanthinifaciens]|uniref:lycopene beta-cyclase CrtY n=1 Tax=Sphingomicrobium astaxanthinifaciens TaxID=1227949 RepID=UPI001FCB8FE7|nr:lycopene beta-cyclase CrtY [Sphingomicrobium astaxanthinifaciens]MCJ7420745.1 lycopene beta-cyclase CrtY [Sphingomicrobium astaxanthinifaciens]